MQVGNSNMGEDKLVGGHAGHTSYPTAPQHHQTGNSADSLSRQSKPPDRPYHVLMSLGGTDKEVQVEKDRHLQQDLRIKDDYLARRYRAMNYSAIPQASHPPTITTETASVSSTDYNTPDHPPDVWSVAVPIERALMECCAYQHPNQDEATAANSAIPGSLLLNKVMTFIILLAKHCHTLTTRALAVAILERTQEQDDFEYEAFLEEQMQQQEKKDTTKTNRSRQQRQQRMLSFLQLGGLRILKQWFREAITPKHVDATAATTIPDTLTGASLSCTVPSEIKKQRTTNGDLSGNEVKSQKLPSEYGAMILPLLQILTTMPFDKRLVTETRIHKEIRDYKKQIAQSVSSNRLDDPIAGGTSSSAEIQEAIQKLMERWNVCMKQQQQDDDNAKAAQQSQPDPFAPILEAIKARLEVLQKYEAGEGAKPSYLQQLEETERIDRERKALSKMTDKQIAEMEKRKEHERALEEIKRTQEAAREKMDMLLKSKKQRTTTKKTATTTTTTKTKKSSGVKKRVRWKDGGNLVVNRSMLEVTYDHPEHWYTNTEEEIPEDLPMDIQDFEMDTSVDDESLGDDDDDDDEDLFV